MIALETLNQPADASAAILWLVVAIVIIFGMVSLGVLLAVRAGNR